jgi:hypothetical protein
MEAFVEAGHKVLVEVHDISALHVGNPQGDFNPSSLSLTKVI